MKKIIIYSWPVIPIMALILLKIFADVELKLIGLVVFFLGVYYINLWNNKKSNGRN